MHSALYHFCIKKKLKVSVPTRMLRFEQRPYIRDYAAFNIHERAKAHGMGAIKNS